MVYIAMLYHELSFVTIYLSLFFFTGATRHRWPYGRQVLPGDARLQHEQDPRQRRPVRHPGPSALGLRRLRREQRRDPRPQRIRQQFLRRGTLLHGSYSASLAAYATVLLGVLSRRDPETSAEGFPVLEVVKTFHSAGFSDFSSLGPGHSKIR